MAFFYAADGAFLRKKVMFLRRFIHLFALNLSHTQGGFRASVRVALSRAKFSMSELAEQIRRCRTAKLYLRFECANIRLCLGILPCVIVSYAPRNWTDPDPLWACFE